MSVPVYILNMRGQPLMPCSPRKARVLLKEGNAKVVKKIPFTIQLTRYSGETMQPCILGVDPGSKTVGTAVRVKDTKKVIYSSILTLRDDISKKLKKRRMYRRDRRNRKTRYRMAKFLNRTRPEGWLPPSVESKINSIKKEIALIISLVPITKIIFEYSKFDIHKLTNKFVKGFWYQKGNMYGYESTKTYVLSRDGYKCQKCKGKDRVLEIHHILHRKAGGTNKPDNLITLCTPCHKNLHGGNLTLTARQLKACTNTKDATLVSIISKRIWEYLRENKKEWGVKLIKTYGYMTKVKRRLLKINKDHNLDALAITYPKKDNYKKRLKRPSVTNNYTKVCVSKGDYRQTQGARSQQRIPTGKIQGFRKFDLVKYLGKVYAIHSRMSTGYAHLMREDKKNIPLRPIPKFNLLSRIQARQSCIVFQ
jgi:RNase H-fold protein (predicted Holliday junction resolvase)